MLDKLNKLFNEPQILLEKPLISCVIGAAFVVAGLLSLMFMRDLVFFIMSLIIAGYCIYISDRMFKQILDKEYIVLEGKCTEAIYITFSGYIRITIEDKEQGLVHCRLRKKTGAVITQGRSYRIYFMGVRETKRDLDHGRFWALEEI